MILVYVGPDYLHSLNNSTACLLLLYEVYCNGFSYGRLRNSVVLAAVFVVCRPVAIQCVPQQWPSSWWPSSESFFVDVSRLLLWRVVTARGYHMWSTFLAEITNGAAVAPLLLISMFVLSARCTPFSRPHEPI